VCERERERESERELDRDRESAKRIKRTEQDPCIIIPQQDKRYRENFTTPTKKNLTNQYHSRSFFKYKILQACYL
jgi:hypothetical protein